MAHRDELERYEATEAQDITRLLRAMRPPVRAGQVPPDVDLTIRAAIWQASVQRQVTTLLAMARRDLVQVIRQALAENPLLDAVSDAEDEDRSTGQEHAQQLTASADDLTDAAERYASIWQACMANWLDWDADEFTAQTSEAPGASERPAGSPEALVPDVIITKVGHDYQVCLNEAGMPRLRLRATSRRIESAGQRGAPEAMQPLDDYLRAAVWLMRSLEYRRQTLDNVAQRLVTQQRAFLDHGLAHLQPLVLGEVAEALGLYASTMRLVLTNTYVSTADGIIALTAFFPRGPKSSGGETMSSLTVKDRIKTLVAAEDPANPLTDQQLVEVLATEHVQIARRTVTQYRRELQLPPANHRQPHGSTTGASRLSPDEEQQVRRILEAPASLPTYQAWLHSRPIVPDPVAEMRQASRDLQTALAHPQLRPAVLLALRAFAQAAQASGTTRPPADPVELGPRLTEPLRLDAREEASEVPPAVEAAQRHRDLAWLARGQQSPKMQAVVRLLEHARPTTATVLLTGERGTGKRYLARLLHAQGPRAAGPYMTVNCAALPETFLEAELFGAERGAFTESTPQQPGRIELAARGTLVLEEIDALSLALQAKLLRVLQEKEFERRGGTEILKADARIVAATNQNLEQLMEEGKFRVDLYYRLNVYPIAVPPLRERQEDLGWLTMCFLLRCSAKFRKEVQGVCEDAMERLEHYPWPGNVRELEEVIEQAVSRCQGLMITTQDLPPSLREPSRIMS